MLFVGVGENPNAVAEMPRIDGRSRNSQRLRRIARAFQVSQQRVEDQAELLSNQATHVFNDDPPGTYRPYKAQSLRPEPAVIIRAAALPGVRDGLTGDASGKQINGSGIVFSSKIVNIRNARHGRPI